MTSEIQKAKPGKLGYVQSREIWSPKEETHVRPGQYWLLKFGMVPGSMNSVEKEFNSSFGFFSCAHARPYVYMTYENVSGSFETPSSFRNVYTRHELV